MDEERTPVTLITGTTRGIGKGLAEHFLELGHRVFGFARGESSLESETYTHVRGDVTQIGDVRRCLQTIRRACRRLDNLINNAGVAMMNHVLTTPPAALEAILGTNVVGPFHMAQESVRLMIRQRTGRIVNISSIAVPLQLAGEAAYGSSKAALEHFTRVLAREVALFGITVNAVGPSIIPTGMTRGLPDKVKEAVLAQQSLRAPSTVQDLAHLIDFFLSPASAPVTGQVLYLGGVS